MDILPKSVHEMFHAFYHRGTGFAAIAQIADQPWVMRGKAAEFGDGHAGGFDELFYFADEHWLFDPPFYAEWMTTRNRINPMLTAKSYIARKSPSKLEGRPMDTQGPMDVDGEAGARSRLVSLASARGVSLAALSALIGRNTTYLQQFVRKGSPRKLEENDRRTLAQFFGVAETELGAGIRESVFSIGKGRAAIVPAGQRAAMAEWADIPRLPLGASAGPGAHAAEEIPSGRLRFSNRWLKGQGLEPAMLSVIEVEGDSMEPTLRDGDEILVDRTPRPLRAGIHVIRLDDVLLVKRLETGPGGMLRVISDNAAYPRMERLARDVEVVGRVVWKGGRL
jgi:hypothetical protein